MLGWGVVGGAKHIAARKSKDEEHHEMVLYVPSFEPRVLF